MIVNYRPNMLLKGLAVLLLYGLAGHPSAYVEIWKERNWYVIILGVVVIPILLPWCIRVLVWRVRVSPSTIEIRSLRGVLKRRLADLVQLERLPGRVLVAFRDGSQRKIPAIVGDLNGVIKEITLRRDRCLE
jgi:hypothetical protein